MAFLSKNWFILILWILLFFLPFLDGGTNFLSQILILTLPLPLFILGLAKKELNFENLPGKLVLLLFALLLFLFISVVLSTSQIFSLPAFMQTAAEVLFFCLFCLAIKKENLKLGFGLILFAGVILVLVSFVYLLPGVSKPISGMNLVYAAYGHSHLADWLLFVIPIVLALFLLTGNKRRRWGLGFLLIFFLIGFILTFSRGAFLVLPPVVLLIFFLSKPRLLSSRIIASTLILIPVLVLISMALFSLSGPEKPPQFVSKDWLLRQLIKPDLESNRLDYWREAKEAFLERPLFGYGWGTFEIVALRFQGQTTNWSSSTHNFYLQLLAEGGIFAYLVFVGFLAGVFKVVWEKLEKERSNPFLLGGFGAVLASSLHSFLDYDWHFPAVFLVFLFLCAAQIVETTRYVNTIQHRRWAILDCRGARRVGFTRWVYGLVLISLASLTFVFGQTQLLGEYYYQKGNYSKSLLFSPWPPTKARQVGDKIFTKNQVEGIMAAERIAILSPQDPSMSYWVADKYDLVGNKEKAVEYYEKAITLNPLGNYFLYQKLAGRYVDLGKEEEKESLYRFFAINIEDSNVNSEENNKLAKTLYFIGSDYLKKGKKAETVFWWKEAAKVSPQWSYFYLELASLQKTLGNEEEGRKVLIDCLNFKYPKITCQSYLDKSKINLIIEEPGFWHEKILSIKE